jgi:hypothetical protein
MCDPLHIEVGAGGGRVRPEIKHLVVFVAAQARPHHSYVTLVNDVELCAELVFIDYLLNIIHVLPALIHPHPI